MSPRNACGYVGSSMFRERDQASGSRLSFGHLRASSGSSQSSRWGKWRVISYDLIKKELAHAQKKALCNAFISGKVIYTNISDKQSKRTSFNEKKTRSLHQVSRPQVPTWRSSSLGIDHTNSPPISRLASRVMFFGIILCPSNASVAKTWAAA